MIIIPDVHGRSFWQTAVDNSKENEPIIFLGDYLDPYPIEKISKEKAISNFEEIIEYTKTHSNVTLLLGNHDFMTYIYPSMGSCRTDFFNTTKISELFKENRSLFKIGTYIEEDGKVFSFSHAPITYRWANSKEIQNILDCETYNVKTVIDKLNSMYEEDHEMLSYVLNYVSGYRGGYDGMGSIVWADVREVMSAENIFDPETYQIFGHTQLQDEPIIETNYACIDCRKAFRFENKKIVEL